ncbi:MAG TPA: hypothetical protein VIE89_29570 [Candidatus Binatia bacterium]|jgi:hypothetical protein
MESLQQNTSLAAQCQELAQKLDRATHLPPRELEGEVDQIQRDLVRLRDTFIRELRCAQVSSVADQLRLGLEDVNVALTLVVGAEYPVTAIKRSALEQARNTLNKNTA